ncbi:hypothetical protein DJ84_01235 [Halorubrum ezzemoulense]|nr:hypothetical protein DJ84_01235 [Halorubrum ezzemoulense]
MRSTCSNKKTIYRVVDGKTASRTASGRNYTAEERPVGVVSDDQRVRTTTRGLGATITENRGESLALHSSCRIRPLSYSRIGILGSNWLQRLENDFGLK